MAEIVLLFFEEPWKHMMGIYAIVNTINGKRYIGSSVNVKKRWKNHKNLLRRGIHHCQHLQRAWQKYGEKSFDWSIVEKVDCETILIEREQWWINATQKNARYNSSQTAGRTTGHRLTLEARKRISIANRGRACTAETRAKLSAAGRGKKRTPETCAKIGAAHRGKTMSPEARAKISAAARNRSPDTRAKISIANRNRTPEIQERIRAAIRARVITPEARAKMSAARRRRVITVDWREKLSAAGKGRTLTPEHRAKIAAAQNGKGKSKLTEDNVRDIRTELSNGLLSYKEIASMFNISATAIGNIATGRTWKDVA